MTPEEIIDRIPSRVWSHAYHEIRRAGASEEVAMARADLVRIETERSIEALAKLERVPLPPPDRRRFPAGMEAHAETYRTGWEAGRLSAIVDAVQEREQVAPPRDPEWSAPADGEIRLSSVGKLHALAAMFAEHDPACARVRYPGSGGPSPEPPDPCTCGYEVVHEILSGRLPESLSPDVRPIAGSGEAEAHDDRR